MEEEGSTCWLGDWRMGDTSTLPPGVPRRAGDAPPRKAPGAPRRSWAGGVEKLRGPRGVPRRRGVPVPGPGKR